MTVASDYSYIEITASCQLRRLFLFVNAVDVS